VDVRRLDDPAAFLAAAGPVLLADEARHNLLLGIAGTLRDHPGRCPEFRLWLVEDGGEVVGAALRTPPHNLVLARPARGGAVDALAAAVEDDLPGVVGALPEAELFAAAWQARHAVRPRRVLGQGVYALERVVPAREVPGAIRPAAPGDLELLVAWSEAFADEVVPDALARTEARATVEHRLGAADAGFALWEDGGVVSMSGFGAPTPNGIRIGPVYTPPELRGRGYASALVAAQSAELLASGHRFCFLYTDLANPTANAIYRRIGYELVCESAQIAFD
jgi:predicted GNAT family acetyltransferase